MQVAFHDNDGHREEHSMDQYGSRLKLSENFEHHWSILISGEIHMDQSWTTPPPFFPRAPSGPPTHTHRDLSSPNPEASPRRTPQDPHHHPEPCPRPAPRPERLRRRGAPENFPKYFYRTERGYYSTQKIPQNCFYVIAPGPLQDFL